MGSNITNITLIYIILATVAVSLMSVIAVGAVIKLKLASRDRIGVLLAFAAGVMITTSLLHLLPEGIEAIGTEAGFGLALIGVVGFFLLDRFTSWHKHDHEHSHQHTHQHEGKSKTAAYAIMTTDTLHNFFDGMVIAAAFSTSLYAGIGVTLAVCLHELPHEFADFTILLKSGFKQSKALYINFASALFSIAGGIAGYFFSSRGLPNAGYITALTAGMFIYISCADLIPSINESTQSQSGKKVPVVFVMGVLSIVLLSLGSH